MTLWGVIKTAGVLAALGLLMSVGLSIWALWELSRLISAALQLLR